MTLEQEFPLEQGIYYLNHAAVSPWPARTGNAVSEFARENTVYGASRYPEWVKKESWLREQLRTLINAPSTDSIALLKNTSEAISVVAEGLKWKHGDNVVSTSQEFPSNRIPWQAQSNKGVEFREASLDSGPSPEQALIDACDRNTRVMAISSVQYGSGLKLDLEVLGQYCRKKDILFCVDAIQSLGAHTLDVQACYADFVMADAHKWMMGPEGIALFYCRDDWIDRLELHQYGWHMVENAGDYDQKEWNPAPDARRFECGSPNMLGVHALSASLSLIEEVGMNTIELKIRERIDMILEALQNREDVRVMTPLDPPHRAGIINIHLENRDAAECHQALVGEGVICAHRFGGIRFSPHFYTSSETIEKALEIFILNI